MRDPFRTFTTDKNRHKYEFIHADAWSQCPECPNGFGWNTKDGLKGQQCGCGHIFTGRERRCK